MDEEEKKEEPCQEEKDESKETLSAETLATLLEEVRKQNAELKAQIESERAAHKAEIIEIVRGAGGDARTKDQKELDEMVERLNKNRRRF